MRKFYGRIFSVVCGCMLLATFTGCGYDDDDLWRSVDELTKRIETVESRLDAMNGDIVALQSAVKALEGKVYVERVETTQNGYRIVFTDGTSAEISDGAKGTDGKDGADAPVIGMQQEEGVWYWTLTADGKTEYLLDGAGNRMPVTGVTPVLDVDAEGYWTVSYDGGKSFARVTDAAGNPVSAKADSAIFKEVTEDEANVYLTLADGRTIAIPKAPALALTIDGAAATVGIEFGETTVFDVTSQGVEKVIVTKPDEWRAAYADGKLTVTAPSEEHKNCAELEGEVALLYYGANNGSGAAILGVKIVIAPKIGDYYYADGTWSDGGLISIEADGLNAVWAETKPAPEAGKQVIGIVCQTFADRIAQTEKDAGYTHGYVLSVRTAHPDTKETTFWSKDWEFSCLKSAKVASTWYSNVNGYQETMTVKATYGDNIATMMPAFDLVLNHFPLAAPAASSGWFLPSTGQLWDALANLCGSEVASIMKGWQTYSRDATWYCSEKASYDALARFNAAMSEIPADQKDEWDVIDSRKTYGSMWTSTPYDAESACQFNVGKDGLIECMCDWYDGDAVARPILAF